jgi:hypothetical protein
MRLNRTCRFLCAALTGWLALGTPTVHAQTLAQTLNVKPAPIVPPIMTAPETTPSGPASPPAPPTAQVTPTSGPAVIELPNVPTKNIAGKTLESMIADAI